MSESVICPYCASVEVLFKQKAQEWECTACEQRFQIPVPNLKAPDTLLKSNIPSTPQLNDRALHPKVIFFSYGHDKNQEIVERFRDDLQLRGHEVWIDYQRIGTWDDWKGKITAGIHQSNMAIAFLSFHSTRDPGVCRNEISLAMQHFGRVYPILLERLEEVSIPATIQHLQWPDLSRWDELKNTNPKLYERFYQERLLEIVSNIEGEYTVLADETNVLKKLLTPDTFDTKFLQHLDGFVGRQWLFDTFEKWLDDQGSNIFWVKAGPGFGKSALSVQLASKYRGYIIANWFCDHSSSVLSDPLRAIKTIAFQMALSLDDFRSKLLARFDLNGNSLDADVAQVRERISDLGLNDLYKELIAEPLANNIHRDHKYIILIDALDEAASGYEDNQLAALLGKRFSELPSWLGLVVTSRPDTRVIGHLQRFIPTEISSDDERARQDLILFTESRAQQIPEFLQLPQEVRFKIARDLVDKSDGMILYLEQILQGIKYGHYSFEQLQYLPVGLAAFYLDLFDRLIGSECKKFPEKAPQFKLFLQALVCAYEPLTEQELADIVRLDIDDIGYLWRRLSQILIRLPRNGEETQTTISFCHKSIVDWLTSSNDHPYFVARTKGDQLFGQYCWSNLSHSTGVNLYYVRRHGVAHLRALKDWEKVSSALSNFELIRARAAAGELRQMLKEFKDVIHSLSLIEDDGKHRLALKEQMHEWKNHLIDFALNFDRLEPPHPPSVCSIYSSSEISLERERYKAHQSNLKLLNVFAQFIALDLVGLEEFGERPGYLIQQALSYYPEGVVHDHALKLFEQSDASIFKRNWNLGGLSSEMNPCSLVLPTFSKPTSIALTVDGQFLVVARGNGSLIIFDLDQGEEYGVRIGHRNQVETVAISVAVSGYSNCFLSGSADGTVRLWSFEQDDQLCVLDGHQGRVRSVAFINNGVHAVSVGNDGYMRIWDCLNHVCLASIKAHDSHIRSVVVSGDGQLILTAGEDSLVRVWSVQTYELVNEFKGHAGFILALAVSFDGQVCVSADKNGVIYIWNPRTGNIIKELAKQDKPIYSLAITPDGRRLASGGEDKLVKIWDIHSGLCQRVLAGHKQPVSSVAIDVLGTRVVSSGLEGDVRVWEIEKADSLLAEESSTAEVTSLIHVSASKIIVGRKDGGLQIYSSKEFKDPQHLEGHLDGIWSITKLSETTILTTSWDGLIKVWDLKTGLCQKNFVGHEGRIYCSAFDMRSGKIYSAGKDKTLKIWSLESGLLEASLDGHRGGIRSIVLSHDSSFAYTSSEDGQILCWDLQLLQKIDIKYEGHHKGIYALALSDDGTKLYSGGVDKTIRIWETQSGRMLKTFTGHSKAVTGLYLHGSKLISTSWDDTVRVWQISTGECQIVYKKSGLAKASLIDSSENLNNLQILLGTTTGEVFSIELNK